jgi:hypothetical protein
MKFKVKTSIILALCILFIFSFIIPLNSNALAIQKICGYIEPDITYLNSQVRSGFNVKIVGTNASAISDEYGYFEITNFQSTLDRAYNLQITKDGYLKREIKGIQINSSIFVGGAQSIPMWAGDMSVKGVQDNSINMSDIIQIAMSFSTTKGSINYNPSCDFDMDGAINIKDVIAISRHFNATSDNYGSVEISVIEDDEIEVPDSLNSLWYTGTSISLNWTASGNNISGYEVYCNDQVIGTTTSKSIVYSGLVPNTINVFYVKAFNNRGKRSLPSDIITITTLSDDHGNTMEMATPIKSEIEILGAFQGYGDFDYFKFIPSESGIYIFRIIRGYSLSCKIVDSEGKDVGYSGDYEYNLNAGSEYYLIANTVLSYGEYALLIRPKGNKPDLVCGEIKISSASLGNPTTINVQIKNVGDVLSKGSFRVAIDIDDQKNVLWADYGDEINVGESVSFDVNNGTDGIANWIPTIAGNHNITIHIDTRNEIEESLENNNSYTYVKYIDDYSDSYENATDKDYFYVIPKTTGVYQIELPKSLFTNVYLYNKNMTQVEKTVISYDYRNNRLKCYVKATLNANEKYYIGIKAADTQKYVYEDYTLSMFEVK